MPEQNVFHWLDGRGWLVLSGRIDPQGADIGDIRSLILARAIADGGVACVALSGDVSAAERLLEDLEDLGAPSGYIVDVVAEDDTTIQARLADAGIIVIDSAADAETARSNLIGAPIDGIQTAYENGAMVLIEGHSTSAFGTWVMLRDLDVVSGLEWVEGAVIVPTDGAVSAAARPILEAQPAGYAIGIGQGSALALGPDGQVEVWGRGNVGVALGAAYVSP